MLIPTFPEPDLFELANIICEQLSHKEVGETLSHLGFIVPPREAGTRSFRIRQAFVERQHREGCGNHILAIVKKIVAPVRFIDNSVGQMKLVDSLNKVLAFSGFNIRLDGTITTIPHARTVSEAEARADSLREKLRQRGIHPDVLMFYRAELLQNNYFHAVLEATKSVAEKIRQRTELTSDGEDLIATAFSIKAPMLALNSLRTESEQSEQKGFANLLRGTFGTFRNPTAHAPKVTWPVTEQDAIDLLTLTSYIHRRLDKAVRVPKA